MIPFVAWLGASLGVIIGFILAIPAIVIEVREWKKKEHSDLPLLVDAKPGWSDSLNQRELFLVSFLIHLILAGLFGFMYPIFVEYGWLFITHSPYTLMSLIYFAIGAWLVTGILIFPLIGFGFFGTKEDHFVPFEILFTQLILGLGIWFVVQWFQPIFF